jgi:hypothetical protein
MAKEQLFSVIKAAVEQSYFFNEDVVIIPAWAKSLMDKINPEKGAPAGIIQATFKSICNILYSKAPESLTTIPKMEGFCRGIYTINIICPENNNCAKLGGIIRKTIIKV